MSPNLTNVVLGNCSRILRDIWFITAYFGFSILEKLSFTASKIEYSFLMLNP